MLRMDRDLHVYVMCQYIGANLVTSPNRHLNRSPPTLQPQKYRPPLHLIQRSNASSLGRGGGVKPRTPRSQRAWTQAQQIQSGGTLEGGPPFPPWVRYLCSANEPPPLTRTRRAWLSIFFENAAPPFPPEVRALGKAWVPQL
uniref:Uncharacterized protein n=1 Tax=Knipowitschia caucasica TaxID=637954 RepID=A0AAV2LJM6_KNICA